MTQPVAASAFEDEGLPAFAEADEQMEPPHDTAMAVDDFGTTPAEMHDGEPLAARLEREEPDVPVVGRLVEPEPEA